MSSKTIWRILLLVTIVIIVVTNMYRRTLPQTDTESTNQGRLAENRLSPPRSGRSETKTLDIARSSQAQRAANDSQVPKELLTHKRLIAKTSAPLEKARQTATESQPTHKLNIPKDWPDELDAQTWLTRPAINWYPAMTELYQSGQLKAFTAAIGEFRKRNPNDPIDAFVESLKKPVPQK